MKPAILSALLAVITFTAAAAGADQPSVKYAGGTAEVARNTVGALNLVSPSALVFQAAGNKLEIPYSAIESYQYSREVTFHLGVIPAIAVGLFKMRSHRHFFLIYYRDQNSVEQVAIFEVPKTMPRTLQAVLREHARHTLASSLVHA